ncbi:MAG: hypothetical protein ABI610_11065 [Acidobacteriota bacterium]
MCLVVYNSNLRMVGSYDSLASSLLPFGLWRGDGLFLDRYAGAFGPEVGYSIVRSKTGRRVSLYPPVTPLLAAPLYVPALFLSDAGVMKARLPMEKFAASLLAALSVVVLHSALRRVAGARVAVALAVAYAFGTSMWVISSQALWQHGPGSLLLAVSLLLLLDEDERPARLALLGLCAALITANRPMDFFFSAAIAWIAVRRHGKAAWPFFVPAAAVAVAIVTYNLVHFANPLGGYGAYRTPSGGTLLKEFPDPGALLGLLFSNRGLFTFSPFLLMFLFFPRRGRSRDSLVMPFLLACLATALLYASAEGWSGGYCYGPRYLIICLPVLIYCLAVLFRDLPPRGTRRTVFAFAVGISVAIQAVGAYCYPGGDSGNEGNGLWTIRKSSPVLAAKAGLEPPDFLDLVAPGLTMRESLRPGEGAASYEWSSPPPDVWPARSRRAVEVWVRNEGTATLSSFGRFANDRAIVLRATWINSAGHAEVAQPVSGIWLSRSLRPGDTTRRKFEIAGPNVTGRMQLLIELHQNGVGPFSTWGSAPLEASILVVPGPAYRERRRAAEWQALEGPAELLAGSRVDVPVHVRNITPLYWHPGILLSYRWRRLDGGIVEGDSLRTPLLDETRNAVGATMPAAVRVDVPPGEYQLVFDLVDGPRPRWFEADGSPPVSVRVRVK